MKIAHVINSNIYSGLENVVCSIMDELKNDFEMIYVTQDGPIVETLKERKIPYYIIKKMNRKEIKKFINNWHPDIIHAHDYRASVICSLVNKNIPLIEHLHNNAPWIKKININSLAFLIAAIKANKILIVSPIIEKEYIFSNFFKSKMLCVDNPVSRKKILDKIDSSCYIKKYDICTVGRLSAVKNPLAFIEIIYELKKDYPDIKAIWVGSGELENEVKNKIAELKLKDNIVLAGFQKNPYSYLAASKIFLLTSSWEGYGLVAFEALTLGVPPVVSKVGGLVNIVDDKCGYLCNNKNEFCQSIKELLENNKLYKEKCEKALEKAEELDNKDKYFKNIANIYNEIMNKKEI